MPYWAASRSAGGTAAQQHTFYTALYHSLLFPNVVSDVYGRYDGSDGKVHTRRPPGVRQLLGVGHLPQRGAARVPRRPQAVGDMVQSLVDDAEQTGWLPKWAIVGGDESQMNGDSADPIIADALAMGVHNFDVPLALEYMVKGATQNETGHGLEIERQYLSQYLSQHYVNAGSLDLTSIDYSIGGSVTLEYAIDDFSIAQVATAEHDQSLASTMSARAANWEYEFNPATGYIQARGTDGSFPAGAAFEASQLEPGGQTGFEEGNAVQYTWWVPQDLGRRWPPSWAATPRPPRKLETFMSSLNATRNVPKEWSGNEPDEWAPWEFDSFGAPDETQRTVRAIVDSEYADAPVDEPGQRRPRRPLLLVRLGGPRPVPGDAGRGGPGAGQPPVPLGDHHPADGRHLVERSPGAAAARPYVHALTVSGVTRPLPGPPACAGALGPHLRREVGPALAARLHAHHGRDPATTPSRAPPTQPGARSRRRTSVLRDGAAPGRRVLAPSGATTVAAGQPTVDQARPGTGRDRATTVHWQAVSDPGGADGDALLGDLIASAGGAVRGRPRRCHRRPRHRSASPHRGGTYVRCG